MRSSHNRIKARMRAGDAAYGVNVQTAGPEIVEMVGEAGFDYVMIDWEHGSFGVESVVGMLRAAETVGVTPVVRVPDHSEQAIKRVLDAGALGIVVPQVHTAEQARQIVAHSRYFDGSNHGDRGACPSVRGAGHLTFDWEGFTRWSNDEILLAISIESERGVGNFAEIAALDGIDALFVGTFDLAHSMGLFGQTSHPAVQAHLERLMQVARSRDLPLWATLMAAEPEEMTREAARWIELGAKVFNAISDRRLLTLGLRSRLSAMPARPAQKITA